MQEPLEVLCGTSYLLQVKTQWTCFTVYRLVPLLYYGKDTTPFHIRDYARAKQNVLKERVKNILILLDFLFQSRNRWHTFSERNSEGLYRCSHTQSLVFALKEHSVLPRFTAFRMQDFCSNLRVKLRRRAERFTKVTLQNSGLSVEDKAVMWGHRMIDY